MECKDTRKCSMVENLKARLAAIETTELWECTVCSLPCRVEIVLAQLKLPDEVECFRHQGCLCHGDTRAVWKRWKRLTIEDSPADSETDSQQPQPAEAATSLACETCGVEITDGAQCTRCEKADRITACHYKSGTDQWFLCDEINRLRGLDRHEH